MKSLNTLDRTPLTPTNDGAGNLCKCSDLK